MSIDNILKRQKQTISNFKIQNSENLLKNQENQLFDLFENQRNKENGLHFRSKNDTGFITCQYNFDKGVLNSKALIASAHPSSRSKNILNKKPQISFNFSRNLSLRELQYQKMSQRPFSMSNFNSRSFFMVKRNANKISSFYPEPQLNSSNYTMKKTGKHKNKGKTSLISKNKIQISPLQNSIKNSQEIYLQPNFPKESPINSEEEQKIIKKTSFYNTFSSQSSIAQEINRISLNPEISLAKQEILIQKPLYKPNNLQNKELEEKMLALSKQKAEKLINSLNYHENIDYNFSKLAALPESLSFEEINIIKLEYTQNEHFRDYRKIDDILQRLKFFKKFGETTRILILKQTSLIEYKANEKIFSEGDYGDLMYIIIKGGVNIRLKRKPLQKINEPYEIVINSLYDGDHFGDLAMMSVKKNELKQAKQINYSELNIEDIRAYLKKFYEYRKQGYEDKLDSTAFDAEKQMRGDFLGGKDKTYFGLEENNQKIERTKRTATVETSENSIFLILPRDKYRQIFLSILQESLEDKIQTLLHNSIFHNIEPHLLLPLAYYMREQSYRYEKNIIVKGQKLTYFGIISKGNAQAYLPLTVSPKVHNLHLLKKGDIIAGRSILTIGDLCSKLGMENHEINSKMVEIMKAKVSLKAESNDVKTLIIEKENFELLPFDLKNEIRSKLITLSDFDDYPVENIKVSSIEWNKKAKKIKGSLLKRAYK